MIIKILWKLIRGFIVRQKQCPFVGIAGKFGWELNWKSKKKFPDIVAEMVESDLSFFS
ncbi:hypothetical protein LYNGBM3L_28280 [Moorena producens 3L]|uniref:Uncharacterized protein n=1 Tax=Moorena producens 3L TaxID=489825 RepID=F4XP68_9CYAN|nr:hypothetical protein LYNGBM3L_28280 [Moorena producens 3L]